MCITPRSSKDRDGDNRVLWYLLFLCNNFNSYYIPDTVSFSSLDTWRIVSPIFRTSIHGLSVERNNQEGERVGGVARGERRRGHVGIMHGDK